MTSIAAGRGERCDAEIPKFYEKLSVNPTFQNNQVEVDPVSNLLHSSTDRFNEDTTEQMLSAS